MAQELNLQIQATVNKSPTMSGVSRAWSGLLDVAGANYDQTLYPAGTSPAALPIGSVTNVGYVAIRNTGNANNLLIRTGSGGADVIKIRPQGFCIFESASNTLFISSSSGTVVAEILVIEA